MASALSPPGARLPVGDWWGSIRVRLTLWYVSLLAVVLLAFSVGVYFFLIAHISSEVGDVENTFKKLYTNAALTPRSLLTVPRDSSLFGQLGIYYQSRLDASPGAEEIIALPRVRELRAEATAVILGSQPAGCNGTPDNHLQCAWLVTNRRHVVVGVVAMQGSLAAVVQSENELRTAIIIGVPVSVLIALIGGWMLASRALSPIEQLRLTAQSITATDLSRRIGMQRDDELGRLAKTLDEMIAGLDSAFNEQRRLTADVSHELRTPLSVIQAQTSLALKRDRTPQEYAAVLNSIQEESERMSKIVEDLLLLARAEAGQEVLEHDPVRLDVITRWAVEHVRGMAQDRQITLSMSLKPVMVTGDSGRLRQMVLNLVHNAIKYTDAGGAVRVRVVGKEEMAALTVADTGAGIDESSLPHIFERFYVADRSRAERGSGLGLSIVHWIVVAHGGAIDVRSKAGAGSTFTVSLPVATQPTDGSDKPPPISRLRGPRRMPRSPAVKRVEVEA